MLYEIQPTCPVCRLATQQVEYKQRKSTAAAQIAARLTMCIISLLAPDEFNVIIRTTTDEFNFIPRTRKVKFIVIIFYFCMDHVLYQFAIIQKVDFWVFFSIILWLATHPSGLKLTQLNTEFPDIDPTDLVATVNKITKKVPSLVISFKIVNNLILRL